MKSNAEGFEAFLGKVQKTGELTEYKCLVTIHDQLINQFNQRVELRPAHGTCHRQPWIACGAAQPRYLREHMKARIPPAPGHLANRLECFGAQSGMKRHFIGRGFNSKRDFGAFGEVTQHFGLGSAQQKRTHEAAQTLRSTRIPITLDRHSEPRGKTITRTEQARVEQVHQGPQLIEPIFHGRTSNRDTHRGIDPQRGLSTPRIRIFNGLSFVENER